jgi:endonuclease YncB( thermonuclease family)
MLSALAHLRISRRRGVRLAARALASGGLVVALAHLSPAFCCGVAGGVSKVVEVTERLEFRLEDGRLVRLAGLDVPTLPRGGFDAAAPARARLAGRWAAKEVAVAPLAPKPDRWGRWLADLSLPDGASAATDLLNAGFARVTPEYETRGCESERLSAESAAQAAGLGLWSDPDSILDASDLEGLRANDGRFVVIEGAVRRVGMGRSRIYLDFGRRDGFTVVVARKAEPAFERRGVALGPLRGQTIRVRGVLDGRFGLRIELADPLMIERVGGPAQTKSGG